MKNTTFDAAATQLVRLVAEAPRRVLGVLAATMRVPPDFDAPLPDEVLARFEGA